MKGEGIVPIRAQAGVKRDGTEFEGNFYVDAQWCRFRRGLPRKIGGYRAITLSLQGPVYAVYIDSTNGNNRIYFGSSSALEYTDVTSDGIGGGVGDRTPAALVANNNNLWQFSEMFDAGGNASVLMAHAAPNLGMIDSNTQTKVWFGPMTAGTVLIDTTAASVSGGVFSASPYSFTLDNDGRIAWCVANTPLDWVGAGSGSARITKSKLIYGSSVRGSGQLTFLVWSLDTLVRGVFVGGTPIFAFNELGSISLMSSRSVVEYNGVFYWMGQNRFQVFSGVIQDLPNEFSQDFLFNNGSLGINMNARQKVWGEPLTAFGEIHWHVPLGDSTECNHTIIFNVAKGIWYDTALARTAGFVGSVFRWPVMMDVETSDTMLVRVLHGTPTSSAGVAANAFDGDPTTVCNAGANGSISYDYGVDVRKSIRQVGIRPSAAMTTPAPLLFEYSNDTGVAIVAWTTLLSVPSQAWAADTDYLFTLPDNAPVSVRGLRVSMSGGATLAAEEVYYNSEGAIAHQHEFGYDRVIGNTVTAIPSWFETADVSWAASGPVASDQAWTGRDVHMETVTLEPDFEQVGAMDVTINSRPYAKSTEISTLTKSFDPDTEKVDFKYQGRILRFKFESNTQGGFFQMGLPILKVGEGDVHK